MKVLVSGATGLVGSALCAALTARGDEVWRLTRRPPNEATDIQWNPDQGQLPKSRLEGLDAVVHLAGENIAGARWTAAYKQKIRDSRVRGTQLLAETLAQLERKPKVLVAASAIGYYGRRGNESLTETAAPGQGFLPDVCREWEAATRPAEAAGIRVVNLRIGVVLAKAGGALAKMLLPFQLGVGGVVGSGQQFWSWVGLADVVGAIEHSLDHQDLRGPVNAVSPQPLTNYDFTKALGKVLHRPTIFPMPGFAARLALGEMADDLLLGSTRVYPKRLEETGYRFQHPTLDAALRHALDLPPTSPAARPAVAH